MKRRQLVYLAVAFAGAIPAAAQTDYYNTDQGRPIRVEDAFPVERHAFELQLAPLRLERAAGGVYRWEVEPEIAYGILPGAQIEVGLPLVAIDGPDGERGQGLAGVAVAALYNLNVETTYLPAFAVAGEVLIPAGEFGPDRAYPSVKGIATRTFRFARFHLNGQYTFGDEPGAGEDAGEASRWMAGLAVDRALPLRSLLITADLFAEQPLHDAADPVWTAEAGFRFQTSPQFALDAGLGRQLNGDERAWYLTFGFARALALRSLMPAR